MWAGTSYSNESGNREWMDDLSLVARMWNEELAAALALDSQLNSTEHNNSPNDSDVLVEDIRDVSQSGGEFSDSSPSKSAGPEDTYFSYDKIDEDIVREAVAAAAAAAAAASEKDLSTIREERESVSSTELGATPLGETGHSLLSQLQLKQRMQRHLELESESSDCGGDIDDDDDEEDDVLVVDLESKRAVMVEAHSPRLRAAMASQNYEDIFSDVKVIATAQPVQVCRLYTNHFYSVVLFLIS